MVFLPAEECVGEVILVLISVAVIDLMNSESIVLISVEGMSPPRAGSVRGAVYPGLAPLRQRAFRAHPKSTSKLTFIATAANTDVLAMVLRTVIQPVVSGSISSARAHERAPSWSKMPRATSSSAGMARTT